MEIHLTPKELTDLLEKQKSHTINQMLRLSSAHYEYMSKQYNFTDSGKHCVRPYSFRDDLKIEVCRERGREKLTIIQPF